MRSLIFLKHIKALRFKMLRDNKLKKNEEKANYSLSYNQPLEILFSINDDYTKLFSIT